MVAKNFEALRQITSHDLAVLGLNDVAYIKARADLGKDVFAIHSADGSEVAVVENHALAIATILQNGLDHALLH